MIYFVVAFIAFLLIVYFPRKKNQVAEANRWLDSRVVVDKYLYAMSLESDGIARKFSDLEHSKAEIAKAFEEFVSDHTSTYSDGQYGMYQQVFSHLDTFVEDELAHCINAGRTQAEGSTDIEKQNYESFAKEWGNDISKRMQQFDTFVQQRNTLLR